jgi:hypothetical protein
MPAQKGRLPAAGCLNKVTTHADRLRIGALHACHSPSRQLARTRRAIRHRRVSVDSVGPPESGNLRFLSGGGLMGALMRAHDWTATPLGSPEQWPQSLRSLVSTCLNCSFPILLWWGRDLVKLYNDAYISILGDKHPAALGRPGRDVWPEIWDTIGPMLARVIEQGQAAPADDLLLLLHRHGYTEECYFSFSYSPIHDESGGVGGVFCPVLEPPPRSSAPGG